MSNRLLPLLMMSCALCGISISHGQIFPGNPAPWSLESLRVLPHAAPPNQTVYVTFQGVPWVSYQFVSSSSLDQPQWSFVERAAEGEPGHYQFHHLTQAARQFYRAQAAMMPGPIKTLDALYEGAAAKISAGMAFYGLAYNAESLGAMGDLSLDLARTIEELSDTLQGDIVVQQLEVGPGWRVAWGGMEQITATPAERDQAVAGFEQARMNAATNRETAHLEMQELSNLVVKTQAVEPLAQEAMQAAGRDVQTLFQLPRPLGDAFLCYEAGLAMFDAEALKLRQAGLEKQKAALEKSIQKLRDEAARKRRVADMPVQVFGINGVWYVRWSAIELQFATEQEAREIGVTLMENLKAARLAEAMELENQANALEQQLQQVCAELDSVNAALDAATSEFEEKLPGCDSNPVENPNDEFDPRATFKSFIDFDAEYLDGMWIEMYREWLSAKDRLRAMLIQMGASQETIDEMEERWDSQRECRPKWMTVFCDEPIRLKLLTFAAFVPFEYDIENAKWEVEYKDFGRLIPVRVEVGMGGELIIPPEQVKEIFAEAERIQGDTGNVQLIEIVVTFDKVYTDGSRDTCNHVQQINVWDWTRDKYDGIFGQFIR